jgi:hypothetical protein
VSAHEAGLTPKMRHLLAAALQAGKVSPWDYDSSTVGAAKRLGFVRPVVTKWVYQGKKMSKTEYELTDSGRLALEGGASC